MIQVRINFMFDIQVEVKWQVLTLVFLVYKNLIGGYGD